MVERSRFAAVEACTTRVICRVALQPEREALENLKKDLSLEEEPVQVLKFILEVEVFSDLVG
jgi:hypothetical protein